MNKAFIGLLIVLTILIFSSVNTLADTTTGISVDLSKIGIGARSMGMGGVNVATTVDGGALFSNPARIAQSGNPFFSTMQTSLVGGINVNQIAAIYPTVYGNFGAGFIGSGMGESLPTLRSSGRVVVDPSLSAMSYHDSTYVFSYGNELFSDKLKVGGNFKVFKKELTGGPLSGATAQGYNADLGLTYDLNYWIDLGLSGQNILPSSLGGKLTWNSWAEDTIPSSVRLGGTANLLGRSGLWAFHNQNLTVGMDVESAIGKPVLLHTGLEWSPINFVDIRVGMDQRAVSNGRELVPSADLTGGVGINYAGISFDYAYHQYDGLSNATTHYFSISYDLGAQKVVEKSADNIVVKEEVVYVGSDPKGLGLITPQDGMVTGKGLITVKGKVKNVQIKVVRVDRWQIPVKSDGSYEADLFLSDHGQNAIEVVGHDTAGKKISVVNCKVFRASTN